MLRSHSFWWLFGTYGTLILASLGVLGAIILKRVEYDYLERIESGLRTRAILVGEALRAHPDWDSQQRRQPMLARIQQETRTRITLIRRNGQVVGDSAPGVSPPFDNYLWPEVEQALTTGYGQARRADSQEGGHDMMYVALGIDEAAGAVAVVRAGLPLDRLQEQLNGLRGIVWSAAGLTAAAAMLLAFWLARRQTQPLQELTHNAELIAAGAYGQKVYVVSGGELGTLAHSFNHMSERLNFQFRQLEEDRSQLRAVLSSMVEGVVALDASQNVLFTNDRAGRLLDFDPQSAVGRKFWEIVRLRGLQEIVQQILGGPEALSQEIDLPAARSLGVHAARLSRSTGGVVIVLHDTSELRRLERMRQEFVGNVSHELKTPLAIIKASVETLLDGAGEDPEYRDSFLRQVEEQAERLHALILDLLSLTRIESGNEIFEFQSVLLEGPIRACLDRHRHRAESKGLTLLAERADGQEELAAWADAEAVSQILDNLVDNALKYTPEGGSVRVRYWTDRDQICLEVVDSGIGIPESDLPRIFERFYRVDKARSRELGGTGLGLAIVKHLAQAMQGSVTAASKVGQGSAFRVRLPTATSVVGVK